MADEATDVSCLDLEIVCAGFEMTTLQLQKESLKKKTVKVASITAMTYSYFHIILIHPTVHI